MALLREFISLEYDRELIKEASKVGGPVVLKKALLQRASSPNQNKRIYPRSILEREIENYKKVVADNRATGELDHPESSVVELKNISHIIRDVWWDGEEVYGTLEILNTPSGNIVKSLMESGVKIGISSRGVGETRKNSDGFDEVDESFLLVSFDLVSEPSTINAFLFEGVQRNTFQSTRLQKINSILDEILKS